MCSDCSYKTCLSWQWSPHNGCGIINGRSARQHSPSETLPPRRHNDKQCRGRSLHPWPFSKGRANSSEMANRNYRYYEPNTKRLSYQYISFKSCLISFRFKIREKQHWAYTMHVHSVQSSKSFSCTDIDDNIIHFRRIHLLCYFGVCISTVLCWYVWLICPTSAGWLHLPNSKDRRRLDIDPTLSS